MMSMDTDGDVGMSKSYLEVNKRETSNGMNA